MVDDKGKSVPGNMGRSFKVEDAKVSEVLQAVEEALFGAYEEGAAAHTVPLGRRKNGDFVK